MRFLLAIALAACTTSTAEPSKPAPKPTTTPTTPPSDAGVVTAPTQQRTCGADQSELLVTARGAAMASFIAMDAPIQKAKKAWAAVSPTCRDGSWYYAGALMLAYSGNALEAGTTKFANTEELLTAAIAAKVDDEELFARIAYNASLGNKPAPSSDACARAKTAPQTDGGKSATYTCAQEALAKGDGKLAGELAASIKPRTAFLDLDLLEARAAKLRGDKAAMKKFATAASRIDEKATDRAHVNRADAKLVVAAAKALLK